MSALYYTLSLLDTAIRKELENVEVEFDEKLCIERNVKNSDSTVTIDLTSLGTISGLFISTDKPITATINSGAILVDSVLFMVLTDLTSLTVACTDVTGAEIQIVIWSNS